MYHEPTNTIQIIDLKTSTRGWYQKDKSNENKQFQLILYKYYFSVLYNFPIENINIEFFIVKRKLQESEDFVIRRIQKFSPPSGKIKVNRAIESIKKFTEEAFDTKGFKQVELQPKLNDNCKWCPFYKCIVCKLTYEK